MIDYEARTARASDLPRRPILVAAVRQHLRENPDEGPDPLISFAMIGCLAEASARFRRELGPLGPVCAEELRRSADAAPDGVIDTGGAVAWWAALPREERIAAYDTCGHILLPGYPGWLWRGEPEPDGPHVGGDWIYPGREAPL